MGNVFALTVVEPQLSEPKAEGTSAVLQSKELGAFILSNIKVDDEKLKRANKGEWKLKIQCDSSSYTGPCEIHLCNKDGKSFANIPYHVTMGVQIVPFNVPIASLQSGDKYRFTLKVKSFGGFLTSNLYESGLFEFHHALKLCTEKIENIEKTIRELKSELKKLKKKKKRESGENSDSDSDVDDDALNICLKRRRKD